VGGGAGRRRPGHTMLDAEVPDDPAVHVAGIAGIPAVGLDLLVEREVGRAVFTRLQDVGAALALDVVVPATSDTTRRCAAAPPPCLRPG